MKKMMKAVAALMLMTAVVCAAGCKKQEPSSGSFNGHEYVDLGLPSGAMWATGNVEAGNAKGYYSYFAWGEIHTKSAYTWENYKWNIGDGIYGVKLTKYCYIPAYGYDNFTDNLTELEADDDPATVYWGEGWHTPTIEEWQELLDNCTYTWTKHNGVYGGLFTASNGNTLFLPGAGYMDRPEVGEAGGLLNEKYVGNYWAKSLSMGLSWMDETPNYVYSLYFNKGIATIDPFQRFHGMTIRPVHSAN